MAGTKGYSGGANRLTAEQHVARGTYRADRHAVPVAAPTVAWASLGERRRVLRGLTGRARTVATDMLAEFGNWDAHSLLVLKHYARSAARLDVLQGDPATAVEVLHAELRTFGALSRLLNVQPRP